LYLTKSGTTDFANLVMLDMVKTDTNMVQSACEGVVEFLLANHPRDCNPQHTSITFDSLEGCYVIEDKRCVEDMNLGSFVKIVMYCGIHCTRCIRFADEIVGDDVLGTMGRGNATEVGTYVDHFFDSEVLANVLDLYLAGERTNMAVALKVRPWDLQIYDSIEVMELKSVLIVLDTRFNDNLTYADTEPSVNILIESVFQESTLDTVELEDIMSVAMSYAKGYVFAVVTDHD